MGDVVHGLPVVSDLLRHHPDMRIDWVVEESFADLPALHPGVRDIHRVALRRWRKAPLARATRLQFQAARAAIRASAPDSVLDLQGLIKSAWIAGWARSRDRVGFGPRSVREPLAARSYDRRFEVDPSLHAIERLRSLAAQAYGYVVQGPPCFDLAAREPPPAGFERVPGDAPRVVLLHATSRAEKAWPDHDWVALGRALGGRGEQLLLPWGSAAEEARARQLALGIGPAARVAPRMSLGQAARVLADADAVVGVDTGLTHLAAALSRPTIALFAATPAWRFGPYWSSRARSLGELGQWPSVGDVLQALDAVRVLA